MQRLLSVRVPHHLPLRRTAVPAFVGKLSRGVGGRRRQGLEAERHFGAAPASAPFAGAVARRHSSTSSTVSGRTVTDEDSPPPPPPPRRSFFRRLRNWVVGLMVVGAMAGSAAMLLMDSEEDIDKRDGEVFPPIHTNHRKPRVVIVGSGWGAVSCSRNLSNDYEVVMVSPRNYFLFTPMLPLSAVGSMESRSLALPIRSAAKRSFSFQPKASVTFYEAAAIGIDHVKQTITCTDLSEVKPINPEFTLSYDYLVLAPGAQNNTFGTPGVYEHAHFLKALEDARAIRKEIVDSFETANLPNTTAEEKRRLLSFCVVGGGPTGVEFAGELNSFIHQDLNRIFPDLEPFSSITLVQSRDHILNTFDEKISDYTEKKFLQEGITLKTNSRVKEVTDHSVVVMDKVTKVTYEVPSSLTVWSTGIQRIPLIANFTNSLSHPSQTNRIGVTTDHFMQVLGADNVAAIGDCSSIERRLLFSKYQELFEEFDKDVNGQIDLDEFQHFIEVVSQRYPQLKVYGKNIMHEFAEMDTSGDGALDQEEFKELLKKADNSVKMLPATAQVASQQGKYLARYLNHRVVGHPTIPFQYHNLGSFARIGDDAAVAEIPSLGTGGGLAVLLAWKGVYISEQLSFKNAFMTFLDWQSASVWGRDISRL
eukprot:TRINITY_DN2833_c0_g1_i1.p1 TRINITY_DN2833_c0_g1~~TRINITY_DN2833_c0_g1_i1.p1  ORF type:complete len:648 (-),score=113.16 TRINITY_DN2833_c0_g1_i1:57-2000(-)